MPTGRNVSQKKKGMKIVQDLPWNTEDLKSGREQRCHFTLPSVSKKMCKIFHLT